MTWNKPINDDLIRLTELHNAYWSLAGADKEKWPEHEYLLASLDGEIKWLIENINAVAKVLKERGGRI
jgi:hypothetical protein